MSRTDVQNTPIEENRVGLTHFAFTFPSQKEVLRFTEQMRSEGYTMPVNRVLRETDTLKVLCSILMESD